MLKDGDVALVAIFVSCHLKSRPFALQPLEFYREIIYRVETIGWNFVEIS